MRDGAEQSTKRNVTAFRVQSSIGRCTANPFVQGDPVADAEWQNAVDEAAAFHRNSPAYLMRMMHEATVQGRKLPRLLRGRNPARDSCPPVPLDRINGTSRRPPWLSSNRKTCWDGSRGVLPGNRSVPAIDPTFKRRWELFGPIANCSSGLKKYGSKADGHKWLCGVDAAMQNEGCVVYSIGSNNEWDFELSIAKATNCEIHTFDCNVAIPKVPPKLSSRLTFHKSCVGGRNELDAEGHAFRTLASIQAELGHKKVDLLKVDIEGFEWELFNTWEDTHSTLPFQISTELHLTAFWNSAGAPDTSARKTGKLWWAGREMSAGEAYAWGRRMYDLGYLPVSHDWSERWPQAREFTFVRFRC